jgi:tRNA A-37 threonylcarbamoyl transferase component Bud32
MYRHSANEEEDSISGGDDRFSLQPPTLQGKQHSQSLHKETSKEELHRSHDNQKQQQQELPLAVDDTTSLSISRKRPSSRDFDTTLSFHDENPSMNSYDPCLRQDFTVSSVKGFDITLDDYDDNVVKIRRLNLNDNCDDNGTDVDINDRNCASLLLDKTTTHRDHNDNAISPINNGHATVVHTDTHAHTVVRKAGCQSNSFFISPNDVMMDPYKKDVILKRSDDDMIVNDVFGSQSYGKSGNDVIRNENDALNSTVETLDTSIASQPPSPTLFDFESDFFSPPAAPVKKAPSSVWKNDKLSCIDEFGHEDVQLQPTNHYDAMPLESFYNRMGTGHSAGRSNVRNGPKQPPQTPMSQRKPPSGRRFPLFQLSPHKQRRTRDFHASIFGESPMPSSISNNASMDHGRSRVEYDVNCVEASRLSQDFQIIGTLGDGSFGTVYKCLSRLDGCTYAIKASKRRAKGRSDRERMLQEVKALAVLSDVSDVAAFHIVRYHQAWIEDERLHIVTDLCTSTLHAEMARGLLKDDTQRQYKLLREMLLALKLIHQHGKVHLDIKPENIFIKDDIFKLGDFGLAVEETTVGEVEEGDCRYMCRDLMLGNHRDLTKVSTLSTECF